MSSVQKVKGMFVRECVGKWDGVLLLLLLKWRIFLFEFVDLLSRLWLSLPLMVF